MEISDDKVFEIMIDTNTKVSSNTKKLDDVSENIKKILECNEIQQESLEDHEARIRNIESIGGILPKERGLGWWSKAIGGIAAGVAFVSYMIYDIWLKLRGA